MVAHIVVVDLLSLEVSSLITSDDHVAEFLLDERTTSGFERTNNDPIAIIDPTSVPLIVVVEDGGGLAHICEVKIARDAHSDQFPLFITGF